MSDENDGSMTPDWIFSSSGLVKRGTCVWPIRKVMPLFIAAPSGITLATLHRSAMAGWTFLSSLRKRTASRGAFPPMSLLK